MNTLVNRHTQAKRDLSHAKRDLSYIIEVCMNMLVKMHTQVYVFTNILVTRHMARCSTNQRQNTIRFDEI